VDGKVYVTGEPRTVCAHDASSGKKRWCTSLPSELSLASHSAPTVSGNLVYVTAVRDSSLLEVAIAAMRHGSFQFTRSRWLTLFHKDHLGDQFLFAISRASGTIRWVAALGGGHQPFGHSSGTPIVDRGILIVISPIGQTIVALDAQSGDLKWRRPMPRPLRGPPIVSGGRVLALDRQGFLNVIDITSGDLICEQKFGVGFDRAGPAVSGGTAYFGSLDGTVYAEPVHRLEQCDVSAALPDDPSVVHRPR
jgi:outer membrane protein assembly factor BamB